MSTAPKLVFVGGAGRSGSTLLCQLLGSVPGVFAAGELTHLWQRGVLENQRCSCGAPFRQCAFWSEVLLRGFGSLGPREVRRMLRARAWARSTGARGGVRYLQAFETLVRTVGEVSGAHTIVDSSKFPQDFEVAASLNSYRGCVHVVRSPEGVIHSWTRRKLRPEILGSRQWMPRYHPVTTAVAWGVFNLYFSKRGARGPGPYLLVRYEDLVRAPEEAVQKVVERFRLGGTWSRGPTALGHQMSGNPCRFEALRLPLTEDRRWETRMGWVEKSSARLVRRWMGHRWGYG